MPYSNNFYRQLYRYPIPYGNLSSYRSMIPYGSMGFCPYQQMNCPFLTSMYFPLKRQAGKKLIMSAVKLIIDTIVEWSFKKLLSPPLPKELTQSDVDLISECGKNNPYRFAETEQCLVNRGMNPAMASAIRSNMEYIFKASMEDPAISLTPNVSGDWKTNLGMLNLTVYPELPIGQDVSGQSFTVLGIYDWGPTGVMYGTLQDGVMTGEWWDAPTAERTTYSGRQGGNMYRQNSGKFRIQFYFNSDGIPAFSGTFGAGNSETGTNLSGVQTLEDTSGSVLSPPAT